METRLKLAIAIGLLTSLELSGFAQSTAFTYQGRLNAGASPANGSYDLTFALFDAASFGAQQGSMLTNAATAVSNGLFTVTLDFGSQFPGAGRWLEIAVRTNGAASFFTLSPRQALTPAPYAITAGSVVNGGLTGNGANVTNVNAASLNGLNATNFWQTGGNAGTAPGANFIGTTDNRALLLRGSFVGVGRTNPVSPSEYFGVEAPVTNNYGGMYVNTTATNSKPFYGYALGGSFKAWSYVDGADSNKWKLFVVGAGDRITVTTGGNVGINKTTPATALDVAGTVTATGLDVGGTVSATSFSGSGAGLTGVAQLNANQTFTGSPIFAGIVNFATNAHLNDNDLFMRGDNNHGLGWYGAGKPFAGLNVDGPVVYGWSGGGLGATGSGQKLAMAWDANGNVAMDPANLNNGTLSPGLTFGPGSGEGIASKRTTTGNQNGLDFYTSFANRMSIMQNGNVGIGTNSPSVRLEVAGTASVTTTSDGFVDIGPANSWHITMSAQDIQVKNTPSQWDTLYLNWYGGNVSVASTNLYVSAGSGVSVNTRYNNGYRFYVNGSTFSTGGWGGSDARWKKNIQPLTGALDKVLHLQGVNFEWRRDEFPGQEFAEGVQMGFVAQDMEKVLPEVVHTDSEGYKAIAYEKLTAVLAEGIKEQQAEIKAQRTTFAALMVRNAELEKDVSTLKQRLDRLEQLLENRLNGGDK